MISVIIPAYNNEGLIKSTISSLQENAYRGLLKEIIVVDAGSADRTVREAEEGGAKVITSIRRSLASQLNLGAQYASGKILYFLFPGTTPPKNFTNEIVRATQKGFGLGSFTMAVTAKNRLLQSMIWMAGVNKNITKLEKQSLFVLTELFNKAGRFREDISTFADWELVDRLKRYSRFAVLGEKITPPAEISARNFRTGAAQSIAWLMRVMGYPRRKYMKAYKAIRGRKPVSKESPTPALRVAGTGE